MKELSKEERIKKEIRRIKKFYAELPKNKQEIVIPLIENAAFMRITLEDLQQVINENGAVEEYKNGKDQWGTKISSEAQAYNSIIKNYEKINSRLSDMLPDVQEKSKLDELMKL